MNNTPPMATPGIEVIITNPSHPKYGVTGTTAGVADTIGTSRIRVMTQDGEIVLCNPGDVAEN